MQQWEYITVALHISPAGDSPTENLTRRLNQYGQDGWEMVGFDWNKQLNMIAIFKRPIGAAQTAEQQASQVARAG